MTWWRRITSLRLGRSVRLAWETSPGWLCANLALTFVLGLLPLLAAFVTKQIIDSVTTALNRPDHTDWVLSVELWLGLAAIIALATAGARALADIAGEAQSTAATDHIADMLHAQSVAADLAYYEDPGYHDTLHRAQGEALYRPTQTVNRLMQVGQSVVALGGVSLLVFAFSPLLALGLFVLALPGAFVRLAYSRKLFHLGQAQTTDERLAWYYHWMMIDPGQAKETRLYNLGPLFRSRFRSLRQALRGGRLALTRHRALFDFLAQTLITIGLFGTLAFAAYQTVAGVVTVGALVMYFQLFQVGINALQTILRSVVGLVEDDLFLANFYAFLDLKPQVSLPDRPVPIPPKGAKGIVFDRVSFAYAGSAQPALTDICLELHPGEVIALVGENGCGKTTLIKLLCRLYDPAAGSVSSEGVDLRQLDPVAWRKQFGVIFQDYLHYHLSAAENIWFGDVDAPLDLAGITKAARVSGADGVIERLPDGYATILGQWFGDGQELSVGEWQKVALARAFFRNAPYLVLDEPTSSLDPVAEAQLFRQFRTMVGDRSAILISHRYSTVQAADRIYVLHEGRIIEHGTHAQLLAHDGQYARLYQAQAEYYLPSAAGAPQGNPP